MHLELTTLVVNDYDEAIRFFVDVLHFDLVEDSPSTTNDGRPKRWVVVRPPGAETGLLLAQADGERQVGVVGEQFAGRVGLFLRVNDFDATHRRLAEAGVEFVTEPRHEPYGSVAVFVDVAGNRWDLLGPRSEAEGDERNGRLIVRRERPSDHAVVRAIHVAAFAREGSEAEPVEAGLLDALRLDGWIDELSWVAELDGEIVGHNICTRGRVGEQECVGLGPIGIAPARQRTGIGSRLMAAMIGAADATGEPLIALLGSPDYYGRFGFRPSSELGIEPPDPAWGHYFQVLPLSAWSPAISGPFEYAAPFNNLE